MVHKKYTTKHGRTYGPYLYENKRVGDKIVTRYVGKDTHKSSQFWAYFLIFLGAIFFFFSFSQVNYNPTGRATLDIESITYNSGDSLTGAIKFNLREGEHIPADSIVKIKLDGTTRESILRDLVRTNPSEGNFYAEKSNLEGSGEGYGSIGTLTYYPNITFQIKLVDSSGNEKIIDGVVSKNNDFVYGGDYSSFQLVDGSVFVDGEEADYSSIVFDDNNKEIKVTTSYETTKEGYGPEYLGDYNSELDVVVDNFNITAKDDILNVELLYDHEVIASAQKMIVVLNDSSPESVKLSPESEDLESSLILTKDIPTIKIPFGRKVTLDLSDYFKGANSYSFESSDIIGTIDSGILTLSAKDDFKGTRSAKIVAYYNDENLESNSFDILVSLSNLNVKTTRSNIKLGENVKWVKNISLDTPEQISVEIPQEATNIEVKKVTENNPETIASDVSTLTGNVVIEIALKNKSKNNGFFLTRFFKNIFNGITGNVVSEVSVNDVVPSDNNIQEVSIDNTATDYIIEYETPAPVATEEQTSSGKRVVISAPDELGYTDVLSFTDLPETVSVSDKSIINVHWVEGQIDLPFDAYDLNNNGKIDYLEWITPHLSNQTFDITTQDANTCPGQINADYVFPEPLIPESIGTQYCLSLETNLIVVDALGYTIDGCDLFGGFPESAIQIPGYSVTLKNFGGVTYSGSNGNRCDYGINIQDGPATVYINNSVIGGVVMTSALNVLDNNVVNVYDSIFLSGSDNITTNCNSGCTINLYNTSVQYADGMINGNTNIYFYNYLDLNVTDSQGLPVNSANVSIYNVSNSLVSNKLTGADGFIRVALLSTSLGTSLGNYTVNVTKSGYNLNFSSVNMSDNKNMHLILSSSSTTINITNCTNLDVAGTTYILQNDIIDYSGTCFSITASNITLNGNGYSVDGDDSGVDFGVSISEDVISANVENFANISDFDTGIFTFSTFYSRFINNTISSNNDNGIYVSGGNNTISDNKLFANTISEMFISYSSYNTIERNLLFSLNDGIYLDGPSSNNLIYYNNISNQARYGIYLNSLAMSNSLLSNNLVGGTYSIFNQGFNNSFINLNIQSFNNYAIYSPAISPNYVIYNNSFGQIKWVGDFQINNTLSFPGSINISNNSIYLVNSLSGLDFGANITLYNIGNRGYQNPAILKNSTLCMDCNSFTSLDASTVLFNVTGLGNYSIGGVSEVNISSCSILSSAGVRYNLIADIYNPYNDGRGCLSITASNITLNGNGYFVDSNGVANAYGVKAIGSYESPILNLIVRNISLRGFSGQSGSNIYFNYVNDSLLEYVNISDGIYSARSGIILSHSSNNTFRNVNSSISGAYYSIDINSNSNNNQFIDSIISSYNIESSIIYLVNTRYGEVEFLSNITAINNFLYGNSNSDVVILNNSVNISLSQAGLDKSANITLYGLNMNITRPIIMKNGAICVDCYNFTSLNAGTVIFNVTGAGNYTIKNLMTELTECGTLNLANAVYTLENDITSAGDCFTITADNITLDGKGHNITGPLYSGMGVSAGGIYPSYVMYNITVKNLNIVGFLTGIHYYFLNGGKISNNNLSSNSGTQTAISLEFANINNLTYNNIFGTYESSIKLDGSSNNSIYFNNISGVQSSNYGIYIQGNEDSTSPSNYNKIYYNFISNIGYPENEGYEIYLNVFGQQNPSWNFGNELAFNQIYCSIAYANCNIYADRTSNLTIRDSNIFGFSSSDGPILLNSENIQIINVSYDQESFTNVINLSRQWYLDVNVTINSTGLALETANVSIYSQSGNLIDSALTDSSGKISTRTITSYGNDSIFDAFTNTPLTINITKDGYARVSQSIDFNNNTAISISLSNISEVTACGTLDVANTLYILQNDITDHVGTCFTVTADNVTFNGNGYSVDGDDSGTDYGITVSNYNNFTLINFANITDFSNGVDLFNSNNALIYNVTLSSNSNSGVMLTDSSHNNLSRVSSYSNPRGLNLYGSNYNYIESINSTSDSYGIMFQLNSMHNLFLDINLKDNPQYGIYLFDSYNNSFISGIINSSAQNTIVFSNNNNIFNTFNNITIINTNPSSFRNDLSLVSNFSGTRFIDMPHIGSYSFYNTGGIITVKKTGYGEFASTKIVNGSGTNFTSDIFIGNNTIRISTSQIGLNVSANLTLYGTPSTGKSVPIIRKNRAVCSDCYNFTPLTASTVIFNVTSAGNYSIESTYDITSCGGYYNAPNTVYTLQNDLVATGTCLTIGAQNITFDGNGYSITGDNSGHGIYIGEVNYATIKNFRNITNFDNGVLVDSSTGSNITNNSFGLNDYGIHMQYSSAYITNNNLFGNMFSDIFSEYSDSNYIINNRLFSTNDGIYLDRSSNNVISFNNISGQVRWGIYAQYSNGSLINGNNISGGTVGVFLSNSFSNILLNPNIYQFNNYAFEEGGSYNYLIYNNSQGQIYWNLNGILIDSNLYYPGNDIIISNNSIYVSDSALSELNITANITIYGTPSAGKQIPVIKKNGAICSNCYNFTNLTAETVVFNVSSAGNYTIGEGSEVTSCGDLTRANTRYTLMNDISTTGSCFNITADNITFDGNGHGIAGDNYYTWPFDYGIYAEARNNITLMNFDNISGFQSGMFIWNSVGGQIFDNNFSLNKNHGIYLSSCNNFTVYDDNFVGNLTHSGSQLTLSGSFGIVVHDVHLYRDVISVSNSENNILYNINISRANGYGIYVSNSNNNYLYNITLFNSSAYGLAVVGNNNIFENIIASQGGVGIYTSPAPFSNNSFYNIVLTGNNDTALNLGGLHNSTLRNILVSNNSRGIIIGSSGRNLTLINVSSYNNGVLDFISSPLSANNTYFVDSRIESYNITVPTSLIFENSIYGQVRFSNGVSVGNGSNLFFNSTSDIQIGNNSVYVNPSRTILNGSTNITLYGTPSNGKQVPVIKKNGATCTDCYNFTALSAATVVFNVSSAGNYTIEDATKLTSCGTLNIANTVYTLQNDLTSIGTTCFSITASNITLDGNGHSINGGNYLGFGYYGVKLNNGGEAILNVTVKNFSDISGFDIGVGLLEAFNNSLYSLTISSSISQGIDLYMSDSNYISLITLDSNNHGIHFWHNSNGNKISSIFSTFNNYGITLDESSSDNIISNFESVQDDVLTLNYISGDRNFLRYNNTYGEIIFKEINFDISANVNLLFGDGQNISISNNNAYINSEGDLSDLNVSANITLYGTPGAGKLIPIVKKNGNVCSDCYNFTALTAATVIFNVTGTGNYTIGEGAEVTACGDLSVAGMTYNLINDINTPIGSTFNCFNITADNVTFNGNGYNIITPSSAELTSAVYINGRKNVTVKNIGNISNYYYPLDIENTNNSQFININSSGNTDGIFLMNSANNVFGNITSDNQYVGINFWRSNYNTFNNLLFSNIGLDIYHYNAVDEGNIFIDSIINNYNIEASSKDAFRNSTFGEVKFLDGLTGSGSYLFGNSSYEIFIANNDVFIGSTNPGTDKPANITLYGGPALGAVSASIYKNGLLCTDCYNFTNLTASTVIFNVTGAGSYTIRDNMNLTSCETLNQPNRAYHFYQNILSSGGNCFTITADNITLTAHNGAQIVGTGSSAVYANGVIGANIKSIILNGAFDTGVKLESTNNSVVSGNTLVAISQGLQINNGKNNLITSNSISGGNKGIVISGLSSENVLQNNLIQSIQTFTIEDLTSNSRKNYLVYNNSHGRIDFKEDVLLYNLTTESDLILGNNIWINSDSVGAKSSDFLGNSRISGASANITLYNVPVYSGYYPVRLHGIADENNMRCTACVNYTNLTGNIIFSVPSVTGNYSIDRAPTSVSEIELHSGWNLISLTTDDSQTGNVSIALSPGRNLIGFSSGNSTLLNSSTVRLPNGTILGFNDAVRVGEINKFSAYLDEAPGQLKFKYIGLDDDYLNESKGYEIYSNKSSNITFVISGSSSRVGDSYAWSDLMFRDDLTGEVKNINDAGGASWVSTTLQYWNNDVKAYRFIINYPDEEDKDTISSWEGVFVYGYRNNVTLLRQD